MFDVIGSPAPDEHTLSQHDAPPPLVTFSAAWPYFSFTTSLRSRSVMAVSFASRTLDISAQKKGSAARRRQPQPMALGLERRDGRLDLRDRLRVERVVDPAAVAPVAQQARVL